MNKFNTILFLAIFSLIITVACSGPPDVMDTAIDKQKELDAAYEKATSEIANDAKAKAEAEAKTKADADVKTKDKGRLVKIQMLDAGETYLYEPANLTFKVGEKITFKITSETEFHTFTIDELDIYETADAGESYEFTITFETAGTYRLYCVPHETLGMIGEVTVQ